MFNHEPDGYPCPFCAIVAGGGDARLDQSDVVRRTGSATAFVSPRWWPNNHGHVFPRYAGDNLYAARPYPNLIEAERRRPYAQRLCAHFTEHGDGTPTAP